MITGAKIIKKYLYLKSYFPHELEVMLNEHADKYEVVSHYVEQGLHTAILKLKEKK